MHHQRAEFSRWGRVRYIGIHMLGLIVALMLLGLGGGAAYASSGHQVQQMRVHAASHDDCADKVMQAAHDAHSPACMLACALTQMSLPQIIPAMTRSDLLLIILRPQPPQNAAGRKIGPILHPPRTV